MLVEQQMAVVVGTRPGATLQRFTDGTSVVSYEADLPSGWNKPATQVSFVLPVPFPAAQPDCFFVDADLRLANGAMPVNSGIQPLNGVPLVWFSWHVSTWTPSRDNIATYIRFVERRLNDPR